MKSSLKPKFKISDKVRISKYQRNIFDKGYTANWTEEISTVGGIQHTISVTYKLKDLNNEEITGSFHEPEWDFVCCKIGCFEFSLVNFVVL